MWIRGVAVMNVDEIMRDEYLDYYRSQNQIAKADKGKPKLSLVPTEIITDIARVREYDTNKYGSPGNWKTVEVERYRDSTFRHLIAYIKEPHGVDDESGLPHLWHLACNVAFLCELEKDYLGGEVNNEY